MNASTPTSNRKGGVARGSVLFGIMIARGIEPKQLSAESGVHESTISRFINGVQELNAEQEIKIFMGAGSLGGRQGAR